MSDEEVDLNALIQNDRRKKRDQRTKRNQQKKNQRRDLQTSRKDFNGRDRSRDDHRHNRSNRSDIKNSQRNRKKSQREKSQKQLVIQSYAISVTGFLSDVSLEDILKLAQGKKIINIKAFLQRQDGKALEPGKDTSMSVIINFVQKEEANQFIKFYSDKMLDGKNPLVFQFRRGIVSKKTRANINQGDQIQAKSEQNEAKD